MNRPLAALPLLALAYAPARAQVADAPPVSVLLFGDATYTATELDAPEGFALGQLVGHMNAGLGARLFVTAEATRILEEARAAENGGLAERDAPIDTIVPHP